MSNSVRSFLRLHLATPIRQVALATPLLISCAGAPEVPTEDDPTTRAATVTPGVDVVGAFSCPGTGVSNQVTSPNLLVTNADECPPSSTPTPCSGLSPTFTSFSFFMCVPTVGGTGGTGGTSGTGGTGGASGSGGTGGASGSGGTGGASGSGGTGGASGSGGTGGSGGAGGTGGSTEPAFPGFSINTAQCVRGPGVQSFAGGISNVDNGEWIDCGTVDFGGGGGVIALTALLATPHWDNAVQVRLGSPNGPVVAQLNTAKTGSAFSTYAWQTGGPAPTPSGSQRIYVYFDGAANRNDCQNECWSQTTSDCPDARARGCGFGIGNIKEIGLTVVP